MSVLTLASEATPRARPVLPRSNQSWPGDDAPALYLPAIGPPPLRFAQAPPPPDLSTHPASTAPPLPAVVEEIAAANTAAAKPAAPIRSSDGSGQDRRPMPPAEPPPAPPKVPAGREAPALLPDETQRDTRPEEIIPFFQFPGSSGATVVVPTGPIINEPTRLPVSTAVYRER